MPGNEIVHFEDSEYISRRPKVENFVEEYAKFLKGDVGKKNPYRDPDNKRRCSKIYEMSEKLWGDHLPKKPEEWGTDQLGFSAPKTRRRTIYGKYIDESSDKEGKFEFVAKCIYDTRTIGGCFVWPKVKRGRVYVSEYNKVRGGNKRGKYFLEDRADVALLEIQHFYDKVEKYKKENYEEFIKEYRKDDSNKEWMIFNYTSNYTSNMEEYKTMYEWLCKFETFENYCKFFSFFDVFVVKRDNSIHIIDIAKSDLQNNIIEFLSKPVTESESIYELPAEDIRRMLMNLCQLVKKRNMKIIEKEVNP